MGAGAKSDIVADLITFSRSKGVYGGLNLDGTVVNTSNDWNQAYYGKKVLSLDILVRMSVHETALIAASAFTGTGENAPRDNQSWLRE
ncbi:MAG: YSC84-related protein [Pseudomonadota bacterium]|nr:YSC84-related protein [Pseudomonadota bacterium]